MAGLAAPAAAAAAARLSPASPASRRAAACSSQRRAGRRGVGGPRTARWAILATPSPASATSSASATATASTLGRRRAAVVARAVSDPAAPDAPTAAPHAPEADCPCPTCDTSTPPKKADHAIELVELAPGSSSRADQFDLVVVGCGPAGLSAADRASSKAGPRAPSLTAYPCTLAAVSSPIVFG